MVALILVLNALLLRKDKSPRRFAFGLWLFSGSGLALIALEATNPGFSHFGLP